jgi:hypothetical protein
VSGNSGACRGKLAVCSGKCGFITSVSAPNNRPYRLELVEQSQHTGQAGPTLQAPPAWTVRGPTVGQGHETLSLLSP